MPEIVCWNPTCPRPKPFQRLWQESHTVDNWLPVLGSLPQHSLVYWWYTQQQKNAHFCILTTQKIIRAVIPSGFWRLSPWLRFQRFWSALAVFCAAGVPEDFHCPSDTSLHDAAVLCVCLYSRGGTPQITRPWFKAWGHEHFRRLSLITMRKAAHLSCFEKLNCYGYFFFFPKQSVQGRYLSHRISAWLMKNWQSYNIVYHRIWIWKMLANLCSWFCYHVNLN